jgi:hypothetical protein
MGTFAVVFLEDHRPDLETFAPVLAELLGLSGIDARLRIRKGRGIFLERLDEALAQRVADALAARGWAAEVVPDEALLRFVRPARLFQVDCRDDVLRYKRNMAEPFHDVPWDAIRLVHAGVVATPQYRDFARSKIFQLLPVMHRIDDPEARAQLKRAMAQKALRREADEPAPPVEGRPLTPEALADLARNSADACLDLFVEGRQGFLRADRRQVVLDYLGARGGVNSLESFQRFAADVAARATRARVTPVTRRLLETGSRPELVFDDLAEYERYIAWYCHRFQVIPPAGGKVPAPADTPPLPEDLAVSICPRCGTVIEAGADRCGYCKHLLKPPPRRLFWHIAIPATLLWILALVAGLFYLEAERRREAIDRIRLHLSRTAPGEPAITIDEAIRRDYRGLPRYKPYLWGAARRGPGLYDVEFVVLHEGFDGDPRLMDKFQFRVDLEAGEAWPVNADAARFLPPPPSKSGDPGTDAPGKDVPAPPETGTAPPSAPPPQ